MSFFLIALFAACSVGALRGLSLAAQRSSRGRAPLSVCRPEVEQRRPVAPFAPGPRTAAQR